MAGPRASFDGRVLLVALLAVCLGGVLAEAGSTGDVVKHRSMLTCPVAAAGGTQALLVPFYEYTSTPATFGAGLIAYASSCKVYAIVTGSNNGPPNDTLSSYVPAFTQLASAGVGLYGYVHTMASFSGAVARNITDVLADVDLWYTNFPSLLIGIFLDEVEEATVNVNSLTYYTSIVAHIKSNHSGRAIFNPGTPISCTLAAQASIVVDAEVTITTWKAGTKTCTCQTQSGCASMILGASASEMPKILTESLNGGYEYVYVTDLGTGTTTDTYATLPSYWAQEGTIISGGGAHALTGAGLLAWACLLVLPAVLFLA